MDAAQHFKLGFLLRCADEGLTPAETQARVDRGLSLLKSADVAGSIGDAITKYVIPGGLLLGVGVPLAGAAATGAGAGYLGAKMTDQDVSPEDVKAEELIATYRQYADHARRAAAARKYREAQPRFHSRFS